jgi:hypothetical protein
MPPSPLTSHYQSRRVNVDGEVVNLPAVAIGSSTQSTENPFSRRSGKRDSDGAEERVAPPEGV